MTTAIFGQNNPAQMLFLCIAASMPVAAIAEEALEGVSVNITYEGTATDKVQTFIYRAEVQNKTTAALWFIFPFSAGDLLPKEAMFANTKKGREGFANEQPFGGVREEGKGGAAVHLSFYGYDSFQAYLVPGDGSLRFELQLHAPRRFVAPEKLDVLVAKDILVNDKTSIRSWLPYSVVSDKQVDLTDDNAADFENLNWDKDKRTERSDFLTAPVNYVVGKDSVRVRVLVSNAPKQK